MYIYYLISIDLESSRSLNSPTLALLHIIPLVDNLEILGIFKDEDKEKEDSVMDALSTML